MNVLEESIIRKNRIIKRLKKLIERADKEKIKVILIEDIKKILGEKIE